jgi:hypothetical protein
MLVTAVRAGRMKDRVKYLVHRNTRTVKRVKLATFANPPPVIITRLSIDQTKLC